MPEDSQVVDVAALQAELTRLRLELAASERERAAERRGRTRAERALRESGSPAASATATSLPLFPLLPIGLLRSCFSTRNGTPRQPLLAPGARARLVLAPHVPAAALEGLADFSHVWVLYVFHANTNLAERLGAQAASRSATAKVHVPRLNGGKRGVLATRSPHRPCPLGLSVAQVLGVDGSALLLAGLDCVDGSPVLDIKPYLPFCDSVADARAPAWAAAELAQDEPLATAGVRCAPGADAALRAAWAAAEAGRRAAARPASRSPGEAAPPPHAPLFGSGDEFAALVEEVLCRDIRATHQRAAAAAGGVGVGAREGEWEGERGGSCGRWRVVLDGVNVGYDVDATGTVVITDAHVQAAEAEAENVEAA